MSRKKNGARDQLEAAWRHHERRWKHNRYVYAVVSRRSRGVSVGLNLNPGKICNFDCVYCQVNRKLPPSAQKVNLRKLAGELDRILQAEKDGSLYEDLPFSSLTPAERGVRDIAFSGDGEPTIFRHFEEAIRIAANARLRFNLLSAKLVLLTNATCLDRPSVRTALTVLDENNGEIWAKLDAGTEEYFRIVNRTHVPLALILENILGAARIRPLVIQTLWSRINGVAPPDEQIEAYCGRLNDLIAAGGQIKRIQIYTVAREPVEAFVSPLSNAELDRIASIVTSRIPASEIILETFYTTAPECCR
jgi:wyosine [tRNA(Phe)-imidazoG37] synthetase (radical SAM superfamily)